MQKRYSNPSPIWSSFYVKLLGVAAVSGGAGYLIYRYIQKNKATAASGDKSVADASGSEQSPKALAPPASSDPVLSLPYLIMAGNKNYRKDGTTLCYNVTDQNVAVDTAGTIAKKQVYLPIPKPKDYVEPKAKVFEVKCPTSNLPDFKETIEPCYSADGLVASTEDQRKSNIQKIAYAFGALSKPDGQIVPKTNESSLLNWYAHYLPDAATMKLLAKVLVSEVIFANDFETQREMASIMWSLINRMTVGSTKLETRNEANFVAGVKAALSYDPDTNVPKDSEKDYIASCLLPFVKAFFMGFFNDESYGATHWAHPKSMVTRCPPAYHYAQTTKVRKGNALQPHQLRAKSLKNHYIKDCMFVRVDESLKGK